MQHKLLLLFLGKKVIVVKVELCSVVTEHSKASKCGCCGHYTTMGGFFQGGIPVNPDFFKSGNCIYRSEYAEE